MLLLVATLLKDDAPRDGTPAVAEVLRFKDDLAEMLSSIGGLPNATIIALLQSVDLLVYFGLALLFHFFEHPQTLVGAADLALTLSLPALFLQRHHQTAARLNGLVILAPDAHSHMVLGILTALNPTGAAPTVD